MYKRLMIITPFIFALIFGFLIFLNILLPLDLFIYDNLLQSERTPAKNIIIIGIDDASINEIGQYPWPRIYIADTINKLLDMGAAAIGIDVLYDTYSDSEEYDRMLIEAASRSNRVVIGTLGVFNDEEQEQLIADEYIIPFKELYEVVNTGFLNIIPDEHDGVIRKAITSYQYGDTEVTSFPIEVYKAYRTSMGFEDKLNIPVNKFNQYNIDYVAKNDSFTMLSLWGVINDFYPPEIFKDSIALIGPYALGVGMDNYYTAIDKRIKTYGVEIHANVLQNFLEHNFKQDVDWHINLIGLGFLCVLITILFSALKPVRAAVCVILLLILQLVAAKICYNRFDLIISNAYSLLFIVITYLLCLILSVLHAHYEKAHIRGLFGRFVSREVVNEIIAGNVGVELGGIVRDVTMLFVDIRGFTAFSEANPPEKVVEIVNRYLELTSTSIHNNGGTIDKYIGDATMAVFNAPNNLENHQLCAVKAAWAMKEGSGELREQILNEYGVDLQFGIGINCGLAVVGNMGSHIRMDYTVIGDAVNTASRLEAGAQKGQIIISEAVYKHVRDTVDVTDLGILTVKNKKDGIQVYEVTNVRS